MPNLPFLKKIPSKLVMVGLNYIDHAKEMRMNIPKEPVIFLKAPSSIIGNNEYIVLPKMSKRVEYEGELGLVIKNRIKDIKPKDAMKSILGFTCINDITARDLQKTDVQWARSKSFDTFCPIGPGLVKVNNPNNLKIETIVNGEMRQSSNTKNFIFPVEELVSFISKIMTLYPGDIISTGTPAGIGRLCRGDQVEVRIEKIGSLTSYVR